MPLIPPPSDLPPLRWRWLERHTFARPRLFLSMIFGLVIALLMPQSLAHATVSRALVGWNTGALLYLLLAGLMMTRSSPEHMRQRALMSDVRPWVVLGMVIIVAMVCLVAVNIEMSVAKDMHGLHKALHIGLVVLTIITSWAFTHTMFALHYAHDFYASPSRGKAVGLTFPGTQQPDYLDFMYLSCIIGTSGQTADVTFSSSAMRRIGLVHSVLAFAFNTTVLALTINILASMM